mmetsp:Transcript_11872/g.30030  ORF Transcript_11872/g.30030 Transcript_11872/m.30030 type:complete len:269 (+) Transcript_11872:2145-2951(+)
MDCRIVAGSSGKPQRLAPPSRGAASTAIRCSTSRADSGRSAPAGIAPRAASARSRRYLYDAKICISGLRLEQLCTSGALQLLISDCMPLPALRHSLPRCCTSSVASKHQKGNSSGRGALCSPFSSPRGARKLAARCAASKRSTAAAGVRSKGRSNGGGCPARNPLLCAGVPLRPPPLPPSSPAAPSAGAPAALLNRALAGDGVQPAGTRSESSRQDANDARDTAAETASRAGGILAQPRRSRTSPAVYSLELPVWLTRVCVPAFVWYL